MALELFECNLLDSLHESRAHSVELLISLDDVIWAVNDGEDLH